jgi:hypothetical protein
MIYNKGFPSPPFNAIAVMNDELKLPGELSQFATMIQKRPNLERLKLHNYKLGGEVGREIKPYYSQL